MRPSDVVPVLCTGILRSGSTWSFNVCRHLAELVGRRRGEPTLSTYITESDLENWIAEGVDQLAGPIVFKAHAIGPKAVSSLAAGSVRAVCTIRDPRDCVASDLAFSRSPFEESARRMNANLGYLPFFRRSRHTLFVRYEAMMANPLAQVARIAAHLGVDAEPLELMRIDALTGLSQARATAAGLRHRQPDEVYQCDGRRVDRTTHLHENHVRTGRVGGWRDELTADQQEQLTDVFHPWLVELGYEPASRRGPAYV